MRVSDLTGEARRLYESWRELGYSERQALEEVERSGIAYEQELTEIFQNIGMSESAARCAALGHSSGAAVHPFDEAVKQFEGLGLSPEGAKVAAIGRDGTEARARKLFSEAARPPARRPVAETSRPTTQASVVSLQEKIDAPTLPRIVARADELRQQGYPASLAAKYAFREMYGRDPKGAV
jgi:hypothetical protein